MKKSCIYKRNYASHQKTFFDISMLMLFLEPGSFMAVSYQVIFKIHKIQRSAIPNDLVPSANYFSIFPMMKKLLSSSMWTSTTLLLPENSFLTIDHR